MRQLANFVLVRYPVWLEAVQTAIKWHEKGALRSAAVPLMGVVRIICARPAWLAARALVAVADTDTRHAAAACAKLEAELARLRPVLEALASERAGPSD
jgi:hypothetical protein